MVTSVYLIPILLVFEVVLVGVAAYLKLSLYMQAVVAIGTLGMASASFVQLNREAQRWMERNTPFVVLDLSDADPHIRGDGFPGFRVVQGGIGTEPLLKVHGTITNIKNAAAADCAISVVFLRHNSNGSLVGWRGWPVAAGLGPNTSRTIDLELDNQKLDPTTVDALFGRLANNGNENRCDWHIVLSYTGPDGGPCRSVYQVEPSPEPNRIAKLVLKESGRGAYDEAKGGMISED